MELKKLLKNVAMKKVIGNTDINIENLSIDSNAVEKNSLFFCINGTSTDGHKYAKDACNHGAVALVCEKELDISVTQIIVENARESMREVAGEFYGRADKRLKIIGVTGTNGKTTTSNLIYQILKNAGKNCALIGTIGTFYADKFIQPSLTTPDPIELNKQLADILRSGAEFVVMEVSAHALYFDKLKNIEFTAVVFTNFTQDHLDFFGDMNNYKQAKLKLFNEYKYKYAILNCDDPVGIELYNQKEGAFSYGIENPSDVFAIRIKENKNGTEFIINLFDNVNTVKIPLVGRFNAYNAMSALTTVVLLGIDADTAVSAINQAGVVSGRLEKVYNGEYTVFVDYAHTPDGLRKTLSALRKICTGRLICLFGCGGNRDKYKRSEMGKISGELADFTVITSDNPRYEEPMEIIAEIEKGVLSVCKKYVSIQDRAQAIEYALNLLKPKDVLVIAGKGCENYQDVLGIKLIFNDKDTVKEIIRRKKS